MPSVRILSLSNNRLEEIHETIKYMKQKFAGVQSLNLLGNPMNPGPAKAEEYKAFRNRVRDNLEMVSVLDGTPIERAENDADPVAVMLREANRRQKDVPAPLPQEEQKAPVISFKEDPAAAGKKSTVTIKKRTVMKTTIENLSERILKSHSEGNRFITNDDL